MGILFSGVLFHTKKCISSRKLLLWKGQKIQTECTSVRKDRLRDHSLQNIYWIISLYAIFILSMYRTLIFFFFFLTEDCSIPVSEGKLLVTRTCRNRDRDLGKERTARLLYILVG